MEGALNEAHTLCRRANKMNALFRRFYASFSSGSGRMYVSWDFLLKERGKNWLKLGTGFILQASGRNQAETSLGVK